MHRGTRADRQPTAAPGARNRTLDLETSSIFPCVHHMIEATQEARSNFLLLHDNDEDWPLLSLCGGAMVRPPGLGVDKSASLEHEEPGTFGQQEELHWASA